MSITTNANPLFSLVVPTYNETQNIVEFLNTAHNSLANHPHEIIVVDDDSPDLTWQRVEDFSKNNRWARVIRRVHERGLSSAVIEGFQAARGDILGVMDADMSHDEQILPDLIDKITAGADFAIGSRRIKGGGSLEWPWFRQFTSNIATLLAKRVLDLPLSDPMSGYFVFKREIFDSCRDRLVPQGYKIMLEVYCRSRPEKVVEIPYIFRNRRQGYSKLTPNVMRLYLQMLWKLRRDKKSPAA